MLYENNISRGYNESQQCRALDDLSVSNPNNKLQNVLR